MRIWEFGNVLICECENLGIKKVNVKVKVKVK